MNQTILRNLFYTLKRFRTASVLIYAEAFPHGFRAQPLRAFVRLCRLYRDYDEGELRTRF